VIAFLLIIRSLLAMGYVNIGYVNSVRLRLSLSFDIYVYVISLMSELDRIGGIVALDGYLLGLRYHNIPSELRTPLGTRGTHVLEIIIIMN
jgi:hypothetical protein